MYFREQNILKYLKHLLYPRDFWKELHTNYRTKSTGSWGAWKAWLACAQTNSMCHRAASLIIFLSTNLHSRKLFQLHWMRSEHTLACKQTLKRQPMARGKEMLRSRSLPYDKAPLPARGRCWRQPARLCPRSVLLPAYAPDLFYYLV